MSVRRLRVITLSCAVVWSGIASADEEYLPKTPPPPFTPSLILGARIGFAFPAGEISSAAPAVSTAGGPTSRTIDFDRYAGLGWTFEANAGAHVTPVWTVYGLWEFGSFSRGTSNTNANDSPSMHTVGVGANANTAPYARVGFLIDAALGYRWFNAPHGVVTFQGQPVPSADGTDTSARGPAVRLGAGAAIGVTKSYRIDVLGQVTIARFSKADPYAEPGFGITYGLTAASRWEL